MSDSPNSGRREFFKLAAAGAGAAALSAFPASIRKALAIPAATRARTIEDVQHIVILMQENRSFDHYFGTLSGVRGFSDRHPIPLPGGKTVWHQSDGKREILPFHLDTKTTSAHRTPMTPHTFPDAQAAWRQGILDQWPRFKTPLSIGYFKRDDIPFQFALAEAFTICDAYHCSVTTGTDPNRIVFWSGSHFDPQLRARGENATDTHSEPVNLRCRVTGTLPEPGYTYGGSAFTWETIPEILEKARISWRIYQDPNDNYLGLMHGCLAFESFRQAKPGSALYENGMRHLSLDRFAEDVKRDKLPRVSWILPPDVWSEHPHPSSTLQGAEFTQFILNALTANSDVWAKTVFFLCFDENDGLFDHVPPPAMPSYNADGTPAGKSTVDVRGSYFSDPERKYLNPADTVSGTTRPWGLGPRVPMYVISPWSRGGWVSSQVFDHTSVGQFIEKRFGVTVSAISPWHRAVCGDLTSAFDFQTPDDAAFPALPVVNSASGLLAAIQRPKPAVPAEPAPLFQESGVRRSRALPYELHADAKTNAREGRVAVSFRNTGAMGAVFHVYDRLQLDRIPRRYTVESGKSLTDVWAVSSGDEAAYDLWVLGPNGFIREIKGQLAPDGASRGGPEATVRYDRKRASIELAITNHDRVRRNFNISWNAYRADAAESLPIEPGRTRRRAWDLSSSFNWYDFTVVSDAFARRFAGRLETGAPSMSDPAVQT